MYNENLINPLCSEVMLIVYLTRAIFVSIQRYLMHLKQQQSLNRCSTNRPQIGHAKTVQNDSEQLPLSDALTQYNISEHGQIL
jgi:hypothetical protein